METEKNRASNKVNETALLFQNLDKMWASSQEFRTGLRKLYNIDETYVKRYGEHVIESISNEFSNVPQNLRLSLVLRNKNISIEDSADLFTKLLYSLNENQKRRVIPKVISSCAQNTVYSYKLAKLLDNQEVFNLCLDSINVIDGCSLNVIASLFSHVYKKGGADLKGMVKQICDELGSDDRISQATERIKQKGRQKEVQFLIPIIENIKKAYKKKNLSGSNEGNLIADKFASQLPVRLEHNILLSRPIHDQKFLEEIQANTAEYSYVFEERSSALTTKLLSEIEFRKRSNVYTEGYVKERDKQTDDKGKLIIDKFTSKKSEADELYLFQEIDKIQASTENFLEKIRSRINIKRYAKYMVEVIRNQPSVRSRNSRLSIILMKSEEISHRRCLHLFKKLFYSLDEEKKKEVIPEVVSACCRGASHNEKICGILDIKEVFTIYG